MNPKNQVSSILLLLVVVFFVPSSSTLRDPHSACRNNFTCGAITDVGFPFWGEARPAGCGHPALKVACEANETTIEITNVKYKVLSFRGDTQTLAIARSDYTNGICPQNLANSTLDYALFDAVSGYANITLLYCSSFLRGPSGELFRCPLYEFGYAVDGAVGPDESCNGSVFVPVSLRYVLEFGLNSTEIWAAIREGFEVRWKVDSEGCGACKESKGVCGYDLSSNLTTCYCPAHSTGFRVCPTTSSSLGK